MTRKQRKYGLVSRSPLGMAKHRTSGSSQYGPKERHHRQREAEENDRVRAVSSCIYETVVEALKDRFGCINKKGQTRSKGI